MSELATPAKQTGTSKTCVTCRARKVRCDGRRDVCANCERLGFACSYDEHAFLDSARHDGFNPLVPPRRRVRQACQNCHARKARCGGQMPKCDRCRSQGIECVYRPSKRAKFGIGHGGDAGSESGSLPHSSILGSSREGHISDQSRSVSFDHLDVSMSSPVTPGHDRPNEGLEALTLRTFDNFFRHVHHIPIFSFLHRASLMQRYHADMVDRALLLSMIGISSLLTDLGPGMREYGAKCIDAAESLILGSLGQPSTLRLQALVFVIKHRHLSRRFSHAFMLFATASRFATALRLNHENPTLCFLAQESRRRLMWALYMLDMWVAGGNTDFALWASADFITIQLPCNERNFEYDLPETTEPLRPPPSGLDGAPPPLPDDIGFLALHIRIHWIRIKILQFTMKVIHEPSAADIAAIPTQCSELQGELESFASRLPTSFRWSESNVRLRTYSPRLCVFAMTHIWWQHCHCDLYRIGLVGLREALPREAIAQLDPTFVALCRSQCHEHARAMADMFALLLTLDNGVPVADVDLPLCAYQCSRMLYYLQQTSADEFGITLESVSEMANCCLRVMRQSTAGEAAIAIQHDMEKLIANGLNLPTGLTGTTQGAALPAASPLLSRNGLINPSMLVDQDDTLAMQPTSPASSALLPPPLADPTAPVPATTTSLPESSNLTTATDMMDISRPRSVDASHASAPTNGTDAFEGALEGLDFGMEQFGLDSLAWFSSNDLGPGDISQDDRFL